jgi:predicted dehydrogenase/threonine dehydrogenase-like Zn-dependent dehydrogenase
MPRQVAQNYKTGKVSLNEVGMPALKPGGVIVRSEYSVISQGTEGTKIKEARMSLIDKARARPDQVKQVLDVARQLGVRAAYQKVINRLEQLTPLGYSIAGTVVAVADDVNEFAVGDRVAAGGAGYANHSEYNYMPRNLVVAIPDTVKSEQAAFTTIGSIAMHAYRQSEIKLGERALVIGLGLVGQLLTQILVAAGVGVIGIDLAAEKCELALQAGAASAGRPEDLNWKESLKLNGYAGGADVVFITAGSSDNAILELAAEHVRDRGVIVVVGKTSLHLDYNTFFRKEIDVRFSRSYGPGRFDPSYEEFGNDYPLPYVRWTERRNMQAFLDLLARQRINLVPLIAKAHPFETSVEVFDQLYEQQISGIGVLFGYGAAPAQTQATIVNVNAKKVNSGKLTLGIIGAGNYASSMLLPELKASQNAAISHVVTNSGLSAAGIAQRFNIPNHGTDVNAVFSDPGTSAVIIATRHSSHAALVARALTAGKAVFVEKPLAIDEEGLKLVREASRHDNRIMVGFNRRYSPIINRLAELFRGAGPLQIVYRVQAGVLPPDAWQSRSDEGGRFVGEAGHFFDVFQFLTEARPLRVCASRLHRSPSVPDDNENISATVTYSDGSIATLLYGTNGGMRVPKENIEIHGGRRSAIMRNFESLEVYSPNGKYQLEKGFGGDKGQRQQMKEFIEALISDKPMPVTFENLDLTTLLTLQARKAAINSEVIELP